MRGTKMDKFRNEYPLRGSSALARISATLTLFYSVIREIFDESAYDRFLERHNLVSNVTSYSQFCQERDHSRARRPRCC